MKLKWIFGFLILTPLVIMIAIGVPPSVHHDYVAIGNGQTNTTGNSVLTVNSNVVFGASLVVGTNDATVIQNVPGFGLYNSTNSSLAGLLSVGTTNQTLLKGGNTMNGTALQVFGAVNNCDVAKMMTIGGNSGWISVGEIGHELQIGFASGANFWQPKQPNTQSQFFDASGNVSIGIPGTGSSGILILGDSSGNGTVRVQNNATLGQNSLNTVIFNGATASIPNGLNTGSGQWNMQTNGNNSMSGILIGGGAASSITNFAAINVATNTAGYFYLNVTNPPALNVARVNGGIRIAVEASMILPSAVANTAETRWVVISGSTTNYKCKAALTGVLATDVIPTTFFVPPNASFYPSNFSTGGIVPSVDTNSYQEAIQ